jgi:diguanylate cyclase (GGDEF)-like protein
MAAAVSAVSTADPHGIWLRVGMIMMCVGAGMWLDWRYVLPATIAIWLLPNYVDSLVSGDKFLGSHMLMELPGLIGVGLFASLAQLTLKRLEQENLSLGATSGGEGEIDQETGAYGERLLRPALETELVRSRRFGRKFALVLVGIDPLRQRFDYRDEEAWQASFLATAQILKSTRTHIDRVYRYGPNSFALVLPESGEKEVIGLISRLRRESRRSYPAEGEPGGPLPTEFGATFFPTCATTTDDLLRRAEVALRLADRNSNRYQLDGAEAPPLPPPETLRRPAPITRPRSLVMLANDQMDPEPELPEVPELLPSALAKQTPLDETVSDMLKRMNETLGMIRALKTSA